jgi:hypothetical protein
MKGLERSNVPLSISAVGHVKFRETTRSQEITDWSRSEKQVAKSDATWRDAPGHAFARDRVVAKWLDAWNDRFHCTSSCSQQNSENHI